MNASLLHRAAPALIAATLFALAGCSPAAEEKVVSGKVTEPPLAIDTTEKATSLTVELGKKVSTEHCAFTIDEAAWMDQVLPTDTSGFYQYIPDEEGKTFFVIKGRYENLSEHAYDIDQDAPAVLVVNDTYEVACEIYQVEGTSVHGDYLEPLDEKTIYIVASVSDQMKEALESAKLKWSHYYGWYEASAKTYHISSMNDDELLGEFEIALM